MQTAGTLRGNLRGNLWVPCTFRRGLIWKIRQKSGKNPAKFGQNLAKFVKTSPFRDRVAELRGPSEGLGGGCALLGCTAASRASVEQPIGTSRSSRSKGELVQFEMIQSDCLSLIELIWKLNLGCQSFFHNTKM